MKKLSSQKARQSTQFNSRIYQGKNKGQTDFIIKTEENSRIEIDHIVEISLDDHHTEEM